MAQILTLKEKQGNSEIRKCLLTEATEAGTGRMWEFTIIWLNDDTLMQASYSSLSDFLKIFQIIEHDETIDTEMSNDRIKEVLK